MMLLSRDRILTTHVGSLPRNETLSDLLVDAGGRRKPRPEQCSRTKWTRRCATSSAKQMEAGIDVGNDGEQRRIGFQTYVPQRMSGFAGVSKRRRGREFEEFPELVELSDAALSQSAEEPAGRAGGAGRDQISRSQADQRRDRGLQRDRRRAARVLRAVHDRGLARHHLDHDAQCLLRRRTTTISTPSRAR